jgi:hypothetical protein
MSHLVHISRNVARDVARARRAGAAALLALSLASLTSLAACAGTGGLGNVLGSVLGGQSNQQVSGTIQGVDTRSRQIGLRQPNGQVVAVSYDNQTQVVYQNQSYPVTALENGDQVTLRIASGNNGGYYTDLVQVDASVNGSSSSMPGRMGGRGNAGGTVQSLQGNVRQVDRNAAWFTVDAGNGQVVAVSLPSNLSRADYDRFLNLRPGNYVRLYYTYAGNSRVELRQFY